MQVVDKRLIVEDEESEVLIRKGETEVKVQKYGATITSWKHKGKELLYLSPLAKLDGSKAIRGGIPIVFPRFGPSALFPNQQHGFARNSNWNLIKDEECAKFEMTWDERVFVPSGRLELTGRIGEEGELMLSLLPHFDSEEFEYHALFHSYFLTPFQHEAISIDGLQECEYAEKEDAYKSVYKNDSGEKLEKVQGLDRMYFGVKRDVTLSTKEVDILMKSETTSDVVVWNPGKAMTDVPAEDVEKFVCIEHGYVSNLQTKCLPLSVTYIPKLK